MAKLYENTKKTSLPTTGRLTRVPKLLVSVLNDTKLNVYLKSETIKGRQFHSLRLLKMCNY